MPGDPGAKTWHHRGERKTHAGVRSMLGSEDHARDLSPGVIFKAHSSGLYWLWSGHQFCFFLLLFSLLWWGCSQQQPGFAGHRSSFPMAQVLISRGKSESRRGRSEFAGHMTALIKTPKLTGLFWHIQNVTEEGFDSWIVTWSEPAMCCLLGLSS